MDWFIALFDWADKKGALASFCASMCVGVPLLSFMFFIPVSLFDFGLWFIIPLWLAGMAYLAYEWRCK
jgi:hypothetical protein